MAGARDRLAEEAARLFCAATGLGRASRWSARVVRAASRLAVEIREAGGPEERRYRFAATSPLLLWRARTLFDKEPETLAWIRGFDGGETLFDVGANVGLYTIYAAVRGARVYAFEPESANLAVLNRNIQLNALGGRAIAYGVAVSRAAGLDTLRLASIEPGAALHAFGTDRDFKGDTFEPAFRQGCLALPLDELVYKYGLPVPSRIKIDVDGLEASIIEGARRVLAEPALKGLLVEVNEADSGDQRMLETLESGGFRRVAQGEAVHAGPARMRNVILERGA
jgi:FkbM family methyltransferase